jgi:hypothetical protein
MSPMIAMWCLLNSPFKLEAIAIPSAAEIEVEEWPTPKYRSRFRFFWETRNTAELTIGMKIFSSTGQILCPYA